MRAQPETRWLIEIVMREVREVAKAHGVDLPREAVAAALKFLDSLPADGMSSMQQDIAEGRPSELDSQNGAVVRLGREKGVPTPINEGIQAALLPLERRARGELEF
jgi:2-dehydropantoate 2-reductase